MVAARGRGDLPRAATVTPARDDLRLAVAIVGCCGALLIVPAGYRGVVGFFNAGALCTIGP